MPSGLVSFSAQDGRVFAISARDYCKRWRADIFSLRAPSREGHNVGASRGLPIINTSVPREKHRTLARCKPAARSTRPLQYSRRLYAALAAHAGGPAAAALIPVFALLYRQLGGEEEPEPVSDQ